MLDVTYAPWMKIHPANDSGKVCHGEIVKQMREHSTDNVYIPRKFVLPEISHDTIVLVNTFSEGEW